MIALNYPSKNKIWINSGVFFENWDEFSFALGFLCNKNNYKSNNKNSGHIAIQYEANDLNGAFGKEGRILIYDNEVIEFFELNIPAFYKAKSAGNTSIKNRINNNEYILTLLNDFEFKKNIKAGNIKADIFPPDTVGRILECDKIHQQKFMEGYNFCV